MKKCKWISFQCNLYTVQIELYPNDQLHKFENPLMSMYHLRNGYSPRITSSHISLMFAGKGDVTITIGDDDLVKLMFGQLNPQQVNVRTICPSKLHFVNPDESSVSILISSSSSSSNVQPDFPTVSTFHCVTLLFVWVQFHSSPTLLFIPLPSTDITISTPF